FLADHRPMAMVAALDLMGEGPAELEHQLAGHRVHVGRAADSVGPEQLARRLYRFLCQAEGHVECSWSETQSWCLAGGAARLRASVRQRTYRRHRQRPAPLGWL